MDVNRLQIDLSSNFGIASFSLAVSSFVILHVVIVASTVILKGYAKAGALQSP